MKALLPAIAALLLSVSCARAHQYCDFSKLPPDVSDVLGRYAACHGEGQNAADTAALRLDAQARDQCSTVERDRSRLRVRYQGNRPILKALAQSCTFHVGFETEPRKL